MPWKETCPVEEKIRFIVACLEDDHSMSDLCNIFGISRKTGYKWLSRYQIEGVDGLKDRSRAPYHHPNETSREIEQWVIEARKRHPSWGPKKLRAFLSRNEPGTDWPAASTIGDILLRNGLVSPRRRQQRAAPYTQPFIECKTPNDIWTADLKGWFLTGDGKRCEPITISDAFSRYMLQCKVLPRNNFHYMKPLFEETFKKYGMPRAIRTDNGPPFASRGRGGLSKLSIWWIKLGIIPERIEPGKPQQNGRHERFHRTLKEETATPPKKTIEEQQAAFDTFLNEYNRERPHEALGQEPPQKHYVHSKRSYPERLPEIEYAEGMEVRWVRPDGDIKWRSARVFLSETLKGELVGLEPITERYWRISFGPLMIAVLDDYKRKVFNPTRLKGARKG